MFLDNLVLISFLDIRVEQVWAHRRKRKYLEQEKFLSKIN